MHKQQLFQAWAGSMYLKILTVLGIEYYYRFGDYSPGSLFMMAILSDVDFLAYIASAILLVFLVSVLVKERP